MEIDIDLSPNKDAPIRKNAYLAKYKHGLMNDLVLHLADGEDPNLAALAECRRQSGSVNLLSNLPVEDVVESVTPIV